MGSIFHDYRRRKAAIHLYRRMGVFSPICAEYETQQRELIAALIVILTAGIALLLLIFLRQRRSTLQRHGT